MRIARLSPFVVALLVSLAPSAPLEAQGVVCGWCQDALGFWETDDGDIYFGWAPRFVAGPGCVGLEDGVGPHFHCSRCGGTSHCHTYWMLGICHIACGPGGDALAALEEVETALQSEDMALAATVLRRDRSGFSLEFNTEAGRIDLVRACDPDGVFKSIPVAPSVRQRLETELAEAPALATATVTQ